jgi:hypothetical protein
MIEDIVMWRAVLPIFLLKSARVILPLPENKVEPAQLALT